MVYPFSKRSAAMIPPTRCGLYSPKCVEEEFSEVRRSKLSRSGGGLGGWTGAKRTPSRSKRPGKLHPLPGFVASAHKSQQPDFPRISYVRRNLAVMCGTHSG